MVCEVIGCDRMALQWVEPEGREHLCEQHHWSRKYVADIAAKEARMNALTDWDKRYPAKPKVGTQ